MQSFWSGKRRRLMSWLMGILKTADYCLGDCLRELAYPLPPPPPPGGRVFGGWHLLGQCSMYDPMKMKCPENSNVNMGQYYIHDSMKCPASKAPQVKQRISSKKKSTSSIKQAKHFK